MANKIPTVIWSCIVLIAVHSNGFNAIQNLPDDCDSEESTLGSTGYYASGSAHSSQYVLPGGSVVTHSKGSSYSSDGIKSTFEQLKQKADQFVSKQTNTLNIPNALPPLHTGLDQDLQQIYGSGSDYGSQNLFNKLESASQHKQLYSSESTAQNGQVGYQPVIVSPGSKVISTKKEQVQVNKKVITHGSPVFTGTDELEVNQNGLDSNLNVDSVYKPLPSGSIDQVYHTGNNHEVETVETTNSGTPIKYVQRIPIAPSTSQQSYNQYQSSVKQNTNSQIVPGIPTYIPDNVFTTGIIDFTSNVNHHVGTENFHPLIGNKLPTKVPMPTEKHYSNEKKETTYSENTLVNSDTNTQQKEQKYVATPVVKKVDIPIKIKYVYDGKTLTKAEEYSSGLIKPIPITVEETESVLKEIHQRQESSQSQSQSYGVQPTDEVHEGYYYPAKGQPIPSTVQTVKKQESQTSHSQTITSSGDSQVEQFSHLPLQVDSQKQYYAHPGYTGVIPPVSGSQIKTEQKTQHSKIYSGNVEPAILIRGEPQQVVFPDQHAASSSGSSFQSSSHYSGSTGNFAAFPSEFLTNTQAASNSAFEKLSSLHDTSGLLCSDCIAGLGTGTGKVPLKTSYGISTSFSSSSTNVNGKKNENRQASVTVNDNGKVDTYNVKS